MVMTIKKMIKGKQGVFRTLEVFIAIFITFFFLLFFLPQQREQAPATSPPNILAGLASDDIFRNCAIAVNYTCINQTIEASLDDVYDFRANISERSDAAVSGLPNRRIYANSIFIAGNITNSTRLIVRLYYWTKE